MAGYFVVLGDIRDENQVLLKSAKEVLVDLCRYGVYSTNMYMSSGARKWSKPKVATFADYFGMKENDYIFFFSERKIYGVGKLVNVGGACKYWSYSGANIPRSYTAEEIAASRLVQSIAPENRCVCFFEPVVFYPAAIDMDEALMAYPNSFKALRVIQGRTFIKLDDEEAVALFSVLNRRNASIENRISDWNPPDFDASMHEMAAQRIATNPEAHKLSIESLLCSFQPWEGSGIQEEMAIEAAIVDSLTNDYDGAVFDRWSYVTHQVSASPAKPVEYMEWMDVFGYSVSEYLIEQDVPVQFAIDKYYVIEVKRGELVLPTPRRGRETNQIRENKAVAHQLMKYVDWVAKNYASGNYPMVKGMIVAKRFDDRFIEYCQEMCVRNYNDGYRDAMPAVWNSFELISYSFDGRSISFRKVFPGE